MISCKLILYRTPYKVVVDTWAINSTYLFWGDIRETYRLFIRLRAKKEKGKFILTCHFIIKYLPVERICCCLLVWLRFGGVILTDSETAPRQDRSVVTLHSRHMKFRSKLTRLFGCSLVPYSMRYIVPAFVARQHKKTR